MLAGNTNTSPIILAYHLESLQHVTIYVKLWSAQAVYAACSDCFSLLSMARGPVKDWTAVYSIYYWVTWPYNYSFTNLKYSSNSFCEDSGILPSHDLFLVVSFHVLCTSIPFVTARYCKLTEPNPSPLLSSAEVLDCSIPLGQFGSELTTRSTPMSWEIPQFFMWPWCQVKESPPSWRAKWSRKWKSWVLVLRDLLWRRRTCIQNKLNKSINWLKEMVRAESENSVSING